MLREWRRRNLYFSPCSINAGYGLMTRTRIVQFNKLRCFQKPGTGQAQIEVLLCVIFVLLLIVGITEMIVLIYTYSVLADASKEGVRYAIVHGCGFSSGTCSGTCTPACTDTAGDNVRTYVRNFLGASLHDASAMTVSISYPDGSSAATSRVRVTVSYPYQPIFGLGWPTVTVRAAAEGRIFY
jgi:hypothetical protein